MTPDPSPAYSLADLQAKAAVGYMVMTGRAQRDMAQMGYDIDDVLDCIAGLTSDNFYKSDPSRTKPGTFHDVYKTQIGKKRIYLKLQLGPPRLGRRTVVISFHKDTSRSGGKRMKK